MAKRLKTGEEKSAHQRHKQRNIEKILMDLLHKDLITLPE